ncbi:MAG TPA: DUF5655 domain-containing protein [Chloroflexota bacterium]|nr:DUF5655 domain-containing protein [Chloroflexota bacterium]
MSSVEDGLRAQVRNIEATYGRPMAAWIDLIRESGKTRHAEIVAMLKVEHGLTHGSANRVALIGRDALAASESAAAGPTGDPTDELYSGKQAVLRPVHELLMTIVRGFGNDIEVAPKRGYLSLRRKKQFAMLQPAAGHVDVGLILKGAPATDRLESAATFNAMFTHRVRVEGVTEVNAELVSWLRQAYDRAG